MGDIADKMIEDGMDDWMAHLDGFCEVGCQYCWEAAELDDPKPKKRKRKPKARP